MPHCLKREEHKLWVKVVKVLIEKFRRKNATWFNEPHFRINVRWEIKTSCSSSKRMANHFKGP